MTYRLVQRIPLDRDALAHIFDADAHAACTGPLRETCDRAYLLIERTDDALEAPES